MANTPDTVEFGLLYPALLQVIPDVGTQWLDFAIGQATANLARRTRVLRLTLSQDSQAGVVDYPIELPTGYEIIYVEEVCINGVKPSPSRDLPCNVVSPETGQCVSRWPETCGFSATCCGDPTGGEFNVWDNGTSITVSAPPRFDAVDGVRIIVSVAPSRTSCLMPRILYERYAQAIVDMALSQLALSPAVKGMSAGKLRALDRRSEISTRRAKLDADAEFVTGPGRISIPLRDFMV